MEDEITSIEFRNYKALSHYSLSLQDMNILVGPNNCGKSTVIGAFRVLAAGMRKARSRSPERVLVGGTVYPGYSIPKEQLPISTENVHTDYRDTESSIVFRLSNGNRLRIVFPVRGECVLVPEARRPIASPKGFKSEFPFSLAVVPVLGPLEHEEPAVEAATVQRNLHTHLASRHFRNFWWYYRDGFEEFAALVATTWPGMEIERPERVRETVNMFCREHRMTRELFWSGFGFQIWCQLLTHVCRAKEDSVLVIDEPEVYLHADVQLQLLEILRELGPKVVLATHSTEIMSQAEPSEIVLIDKAARSAERLRDVAGIQVALELMGSVQNITLTRLARSRRVLFVEGGDFRLLARLARVAGFPEIASSTGIVSAEAEGFSGWQRVNDVAWGVKRALGAPLLIGTILDRDYYSDEQVKSVEEVLTSNVAFVHIHQRKELENYLLIPAVLHRAIERAIGSRDEKSRARPTLGQVEEILRGITDPLKDEVLSQLIAQRIAYLRSSGLDPATITLEVVRRVEALWPDLGARLAIVPGKEVLKRFREVTQRTFAVTLTDHRITAAFNRSDIPDDLLELFDKIEHFRTCKVKAAGSEE